MRKTKQTLKVLASEEIAAGIWSLILQYKEGCAPGTVRPGQFVGVYPADASTLLPRPISICEWLPQERAIRLVYRVAGKGTEEFSYLERGDTVDILGVLGNGYDVSRLSGKKVLLIGGGIGAPPMLGLAKTLSSASDEAGTEVTAVMGYRTNDLFLADDFRKVSHFVPATDDGTAGFHGNAVEAARAEAGKFVKADKNGEVPEKPRESLKIGTGRAFDVICACGPLPMLRGVKCLAAEWGIPALLSLEERMACGVGACLGCVVRTTEKDEHSHVKNARVCTEGPVFYADQVDI